MVVLTSILLAVALIGPDRLISDETQTIDTAYNIAEYGVSSSQRTEASAPAPDMRREPLYPFMVSLVLRAGDPSLDCLVDNAPLDGCRAIRVAVRAVNAILLAALVVMTYASARLLLPTNWALGAAAAVGLSPALLQYSNQLLTEPLAALLLLSGSYGLCRAQSDPEKFARWAFVTGCSFGLLILVKAIFLFVLPGIALLVAARTKSFPKGVVTSLVFVATAALVFGPWSIRNAVNFDDPLPSSGSPQVLAVRAESMDMTGTEYMTSFVYNTGIVGPKVEARLFDDESYRRHDRKNPDSSRRQVFLDDGGFAAYQRSASTREAILDRPVKFVSLSGPFAWRAHLARTQSALPHPSGGGNPSDQPGPDSHSSACPLGGWPSRPFYR